MTHLRNPALGAATVALFLVLGACSQGSETTTTSPASVTSAASATTTTPLTSAPTTQSATTTTTAHSTTTTSVAPVLLDTGAQATTDRLVSDLDRFGLHDPRVSGSTQELATIASLSEAVTEIMGFPPIVVPFDLPNEAVSANVLTLPIGTGDFELLLGAHVDSVPGSPGTDDNGSGVVVLVELLRRLVESPPTNVRVSIAFFGAEEVIEGGSADDHHYGSRQQAGLMAISGALPDMMISVDMVGIGEQLLGVAYEDEDTPIQANAAKAIFAAATGLGLSVDTVIRGDISDHEAFARAGVDAAMMWRPDNPTWHTADDNAIDPDLLLANIAVLESIFGFIGGV